MQINLVVYNVHISIHYSEHQTIKWDIPDSQCCMSPDPDKTEWNAVDDISEHLAVGNMEH